MIAIGWEPEVGDQNENVLHAFVVLWSPSGTRFSGAILGGTEGLGRGGTVLFGIRLIVTAAAGVLYLLTRLAPAGKDLGVIKFEERRKRDEKRA